VSASSSGHATIDVRLPSGVALHARCARSIVLEAADLRCRVTVAANGRQADASSILELLALGATGGTELRLIASGDDAAEAVARLSAVVSGLR
jgi:phosphotransferase system HPr (HPr) family protein